MHSLQRQVSNQESSTMSTGINAQMKTLDAPDKLLEAQVNQQESFKDPAHMNTQTQFQSGTRGLEEKVMDIKQNNLTQSKPRPRPRPHPYTKDRESTAKDSNDAKYYRFNGSGLSPDQKGWVHLHLTTWFDVKNNPEDTRIFIEQISGKFLTKFPANDLVQEGSALDNAHFRAYTLTKIKKVVLQTSANAITLSDSLLHAAFMSTLGDIYETTNIGSPNSSPPRSVSPTDTRYESREWSEPPRSTTPIDTKEESRKCLVQAIVEPFGILLCKGDRIELMSFYHEIQQAWFAIWPVDVENPSQRMKHKKEEMNVIVHDVTALHFERFFKKARAFKTGKAFPHPKLSLNADWHAMLITGIANNCAQYDLDIVLRTKLAWHFVPVFRQVMSTPFQKEFLDSLANIWASHWPEDTTYGRKDKDHRTLLSKRVVWPPGVSSGEFDIEDFEIRHAVSHKEAHIRKRDAENIRTYKQMRKFLSHKEKRDAWFEMRWSILKFLKAAVENVGEYIAGVDRPAADWKESLREAVFLWGAHNHLPEHFKQEYPHWPKYRYLVATPPNNEHLLIKWEYPSLPSPLWYTSPLPSSDEDRAPTPPSPWIVQKDVYLIIIPACPQYLVITILFKLHFSASANTIKTQTAHRAVELSFTHLSHECETVHIKLPHEYPGLNSQPVNEWSYGRLKTTFGWHMLPTWLAVRGTEFELAFLQQATITWALHWPEDIISSVVVPTGATTTWTRDKDTEGVHDVDFDFELNQLYGSMTYDEVEFAIESLNMAGA
ncbi:hypothetical protein EV359DRAFT_62895 [Lentinula novae-zelandiae]|nr:hypothetical protein EV359DRAFT_62895 [Lentinula novae-zelandiae]